MTRELRIGAGSYGINMLRKIGVISSVSVLLSGCGILPGMENLNTTQMRRYIAPEKVAVCPTLIPITPSLLSDQRVSTYFYHVAPADVLHITVWEHPEFLIEVQTGGTNQPGVQGAAGLPGYLVNSSGNIFFPLIGYVTVAGKTVDEIRSDITFRLRKYVPNPQVNVRVADFRGQKVYVLGEVPKTGFLPITDQKLTIADALALSGWLSPDSADPAFIYVIRGDYTHPQIFWLDAKTPDKILLAERFSLQPDDILVVSSAPLTRWNRILAQVWPTIQAVWTTQSIIKQSQTHW